jgi:hypothetical protein
MPDCCKISCMRSKVVFLLKKIEVLVRLSFCPDPASYTPSIFNSRLNSTDFALQNKRLSFAKNKLFNLGPFGEVGTPVITPLLSALRSSVLRTSTH